MSQSDNSFCLLSSCWRYVREVPGVNRLSKAADLLGARQAGGGRDFGRKKVPAGLPKPPELHSQTPTSRPISGVPDLIHRGTRHFLLMRTSPGEFSSYAKSPMLSPSRDRYWEVGMAPRLPP